MEYKDYYQILGVDNQASPDDIEKTYRKLARKYHPDINPGDHEAGKRYQEITEARVVLTDPDRRAKFEELAARWQAHQQAGRSDAFAWNEWRTTSGDWSDTPVSEAGRLDSNFSEFYQAIFAGVGDAPKPQTATRAGEDYNQQIEISLEEAFQGVSRVLRVGDRRIEVKIPRGAKTGTKVRVRGHGGEGEGGGPKGDLYLEIVVTPHPLFEWVGDDLQADLPVDLYTAILGGEAVVPTFKGKIKLKIPPETQSGRTFRLKGQGMPRLKQPDERGDLYAKVVVQLPQNLSPDEIALFEELADIRGL